jgi:ribosomal protein L11 methylase PrmA
MKIEVEAGSFRDPSGFVFFKEGVCYRQINLSYKNNYDLLLESGLYAKLVSEGLLIPHEKVDVLSTSSNAYLTIRPEPIPFVSYPYEWCFTQFKNAALTTLTILKNALSYDMILKDASAYNIQFYQGQSILIDTLSFEKYQEGEPWAGYKQFCENFLGPLALMAYTDIRLARLLRDHIEGIPLDLTSSLLPKKTYFNFHLAAHIHLHARFQKKHAEKTSATKSSQTISKKSLLGLVDSLESAIKKMNLKSEKSEWGDYYSQCAHVPKIVKEKIALVTEYLDYLKPHSVWDLGANTGVFSRVASDRGILTISIDGDHNCVENSYLQTLKSGEKNLLPIWIDLNNPSPGIGWENKERKSLWERGPAETILALALIHHLAISNNVPLAKIALLFRNTCLSLIIEFVPKSDSMVQKLLASRQDIFPDYTQKAFENEFSQFFDIIRSEKVGSSERTLYLMKNKKQT